MARVIVEREMHGIAADDIWKLAKDLSRYPEIMHDVVSTTTRSIDGKPASDWKVLLNGNELQWTEVDTLDETSRTFSFEQVEGDLAHWAGYLHIEPTGSGCRSTYQIDFEVGVPALAHILEPLGERSIRDNCNKMLTDLEAHCRANSGTSQTL